MTGYIMAESDGGGGGSGDRWPGSFLECRGRLFVYIAYIRTKHYVHICFEFRRGFEHPELLVRSCLRSLGDDRGNSVEYPSAGGACIARTVDSSAGIAKRLESRYRNSGYDQCEIVSRYHGYRRDAYSSRSLLGAKASLVSRGRAS